MMKKIPDQSIVLTNCNMIDGNAEEPLSDTTIIINKNKIISVESRTHVNLPSNVNVIDVSGQTVLPGLIDLHLHLLYYFNRPDISTAQYNNPKITLIGAWHMSQLLDAGITSVRDAGSVDHLIFDLKWALREGLIRGPRIWASGRMISPTGGHGAGLNIEFDGCAAGLNAVREEIKAGADFIKIGYLENEWTLDELKIVVDQSHRMSRKVACHVNFPPSITNALNVGVDSIEHGCLVTQNELKQMLNQGTFWVITPLIYKKQFEKFKALVADPTTPKNLLPNAESQVKRHEWIWENMPKAILSAAEMGVKIGIGSDQLYPEVGIAALPLDMALLVELGLQPIQVIQAATSRAAECIGCKDELGTLEVGKLADLIVVDGDPLKDIHSLQKVTLVIKDGQIEKNLIS